MRTGAHCLSLRLHPRQRIAWLEPPAAAARRLGDKKAEGNRLGNLGIAYAALGEVRTAIEQYEAALAIFEAIEDPNAEKVRRLLAALQED